MPHEWLRTVCLTALAAVAWVLAAAPAAAESRRALVFGDDAYENVDPLEKAVSDARVISAALAGTGFAVTREENVGRRAFNRALQGFTSTLAPGDIAFFFFAGHGVAIEGRNYLLPSDIPEARPGQEQFVRSEAIAVDEVMAAIADTGARISILVIDACRDNPFARHGTRSLGNTRGLARTAPPAGSFVIYSAGVGQTALDRLDDADDAANSVFTRALAPLLAEPGLALVETARRVRREVQALAATVGHEQRPAYYDEVSGDFFIAGKSENGPVAPAPVTAVETSGAAEAWNTTKDSTSVAVLSAFAEAFPGTVYAAMAEARIAELEAAGSAPAGEDNEEAGSAEQVAAADPAPAETQPARRLHYVTGLDASGDNWLALRTAPASSAALIARMGPETLLDVVGRSGAWLEVVVEDGAHRGRRGWAYSGYVACCRDVGSAGQTASTRETIQLHYLTGLNPLNDNWLALRTAPSASSGRRLAKMGPETLLYVVSRSGVWLEVVVQNTEFEGYRGWAHSGYIACCREVPVR